MVDRRDKTQGWLPVDVAVDTPNAFEMPGIAATPTPPSYDEIANNIAPADHPEKWFSPAERSTAIWLRRRGVELLSVERRKGHLLKTPDAMVGADPVTVELKSASGSVNSLVQRIRSGRWQSRRVVIDVRGTGTTQTSAEAALRRALVRYQDDLDEVVVVVTDGLSVGWKHG